MKRVGGGESRAARKRRKGKSRLRNALSLEELDDRDAESAEEQPKLSEEMDDYDEDEALGDTIHPSILHVKSKQKISEDADGVDLGHLVLEIGEEVDSGIRAQKALEWLLDPMDADEFRERIWESQVLVLKRGNESFLQNWTSEKEVLSWLDEFSGDVELRTGLEDTESISCSEVRGRISQGKTVWIQNAFRISEDIMKLSSILEEEFADVPNSSLIWSPGKDRSAFSLAKFHGAETFFLQLEGESVWRIYSPSVHIPRASGLVDEHKQLLFEVRIESGDLIYLPKGFGFEFRGAKTSDHSLLLCLEVGEGNTVADLLEMVVPQAIEEVIETMDDARLLLPKNYLHILGVSNSELLENQDRMRFQEMWGALLDRIKFIGMEYLDAAADQMAKNYLLRKLPLEKNSKSLSSAPKITPDSRLTPVRRDIARFLLEDDRAWVYHCVNNSENTENEMSNCLEFDLADAPAVEQILKAYPQALAIAVKDLEIPEGSNVLQRKLAVARRLYSAGILRIVEEDSSEDEQ